ncbi:hypothetical protein B7C51_09410 [Paenibacillus larvae subsp. pulvifaciens]|uniref:Uncharacterized protein n=1 Tax=Paenibacillus larvae subsp. pulvifaciens TaxID=1477 RepID=A0A1V0US51_9BACL|nr:hypothetical protein B7C51_09410 [Paenibacillus larvae subsp. pulvifaciens]
MVIEQLEWRNILFYFGQERNTLLFFVVAPKRASWKTFCQYMWISTPTKKNLEHSAYYSTMCRHTAIETKKGLSLKGERIDQFPINKGGRLSESMFRVRVLAPISL